MKYVFKEGPDRSILYVCLHGYLSGRGFENRCMMHEHVDTLYPKVARGRWKKRTKGELIKTVISYRQDYDHIFLLGHSQGAQFVFYYNDPVFSGIVCYSGLRLEHLRINRDQTPVLYVCGEFEKLPTREHTLRMYREDAQLGIACDILTSPTGHFYNPKINPEIIQSMNYLVHPVTKE